MALKTTMQCKIAIATSDASGFVGDLKGETAVSAPVESFVQSAFAGVVYAEVRRYTFCTRSTPCHLLCGGPMSVIALLEGGTTNTLEGTSRA